MKRKLALAVLALGGGYITALSWSYAARPRCGPFPGAPSGKATFADKFFTCHRKALNGQSSAGGELRATLTYGEDGIVYKVTTLQIAPDDALIRDCIQEAGHRHFIGLPDKAGEIIASLKFSPNYNQILDQREKETHR